MLSELNLCPSLNISAYSELAVHIDNNDRAVWYHMSPSGRPCFSLPLLSDLKGFQSGFAEWYQFVETRPDYLVMASQVPGIFNLGGDLALFIDLISTDDREGLYRYAKACVDVMYTHMTGLGCDIITISLVQGHALGGGFEAALASDVLIAEESATFGFPEIMFNMFPGMGAYSMLSRKLGGAAAEKMILSNHMYTARELYEMGLITILAEDGKGRDAVLEYMENQKNQINGVKALMKTRRTVNPVTLEEMEAVIRIWLDAALSLSSRDLRVMARLVARQQRKVVSAVT